MNNIINWIKKNKFKYQYKDDYVVIINSNNGNRIEIIRDGNEYILSFKTQHCHFNDIDDVYDYINKFVNDELFSIELYDKDIRKFGGDISKDLYDNLTIRFLAAYFYCDENIISGFNYDLYSWSGKYDISRESVANLKGE